MKVVNPVINNKKICIKCSENKCTSEFYISKSSKNGFRGKCKTCCLEENKINKKIYRAKPEIKVKEKEAFAIWQKANRDRLNKLQNSPENKDKKNKKRREKYKNDICYNIEHRYRSRLQSVTRNIQYKKQSRTLSYLGCNTKEYKEHLEKQFLEGMNWGNRDRWDIDHIKPCCAFDLFNESHLKECFHYSNLRPLWKELNSQKIKSDIQWKKQKINLN